MAVFGVSLSDGEKEPVQLPVGGVWACAAVFEGRKVWVIVELDEDNLPHLLNDGEEGAILEDEEFEVIRQNDGDWEI